MGDEAGGGGDETPISVSVFVYSFWSPSPFCSFDSFLFLLLLSLLFSELDESKCTKCKNLLSWIIALAVMGGATALVMFLKGDFD